MSKENSVQVSIPKNAIWLIAGVLGLATAIVIGLVVYNNVVQPTIDTSVNAAKTATNEAAEKVTEAKETYDEASARETARKRVVKATQPGATVKLEPIEAEKYLRNEARHRTPNVPDFSAPDSQEKYPKRYFYVFFIENSDGTGEAGYIPVWAEKGVAGWQTVP